MKIFLFSLILTLGSSQVALADEVRVAVAANFSGTLKTLAREFETRSGHSVIISAGSTGRHYAQIINGAPFDVFLAADSARPELLVETGRVPATALFDYAIGRLAIWSPGARPDENLATWIAGLPDFAMANPRLAPYGLATQQTLTNLGISGKQRIVTGESISQTFQFVASGNVTAGFVALAQLRLAGTPPAEYRLVPQNLHAPIRQQGVLLGDSAAAAGFVKFLRGAGARAIIEKSGYELPLTYPEIRD